MIEEYILIIAQDFVRKLLKLFFRENNDGKTYIVSNQQENYIFYRKKVILRFSKVLKSVSNNSVHIEAHL